mgnify:CR=1 FL=1
MKSYRKELWFDIPSRRELRNITPEVTACLRESGIREGLLLCNAMHITASVFINDHESGLHRDYKKWLEQLAPFDPARTLFVDDSLPVLRSAHRYGIAELLAILEPDTRQARREVDEFAAVPGFGPLLPELRDAAV